MIDDILWKNNTYTRTTPTKAEVVKLDSFRNRRSASVTLTWKDRLNLELADLNEEYFEKEGIKIDSINIFHAKNFLDSLPVVGIMPPTIGIEVEGGILFEWHKIEESGKSTIFSVVIHANSIIFALYLNGTRNDLRGGLNFSNDAIEMLLPKIKKYFSTSSKYIRQRA